MIRTDKGNVRSCLCLITVLYACTLWTSAACAEPDLLIYPASTATFEYDDARFDVLPSTHPAYEPIYSIGNQMLWDAIAQRVPVEVYRAPALHSFKRSSDESRYVIVSNEFDMVVDGWGETPRFLGNVTMRFLPDPPQSVVSVWVDGVAVEGLTHRVGNLNVTTPVPGGYADTRTHRIRWYGSVGLRVIVFSDRDGDGAYDGPAPRFCILARDNAVPVENRSWGSVKSMFAE